MKRREFVRGLALTTAGAAGAWPTPTAAEPPPETTRLRIRGGIERGGFCSAPQYVAEELLRSEGFTDVQYPKSGPEARFKALASGDVDLDTGFIGNQIVRIDAGDPLVVLAGIHVGCFELFARDTVRTPRDLKGKAVAVTSRGSGRHLFLASLMAYIGLDARKDAELVVRPAAESVELFAEGKIDAYQAFADDVYALRDRKLGRSLVNSATDRPWSQYFCCTLVANREFVRKHPVATRRALRAILKGIDMCALEPERAARLLADRGWIPTPGPTRRMLADLPYDRWRRLDPEETMRFYALRLREAGLIKGAPQRIIAQGTAWQFLKELKKELKG